MTRPTPRDVAPGGAQRLQAIEGALAGIDALGELPVDEAFARLEAAHQVLADVLNPGPGRREEPGPGTIR
ncbi:hypothetical protein [[Pseudopropionibacterium] massiliense]|uniref:hypothetical protein n=1 Tax=[Pseudopropionibacterium] massiliense TaxID=2220000 RepID=UPI001031480C|nr:hypothetical protein [[Pseudopropionibacterium] massiliense]